MNTIFKYLGKVPFYILLIACSSFLFLNSPKDTLAATFTRKVFLQNVTTSSIEFRWVTDTQEALTVLYGTTTSYGSQVTSDTVSGTGGNNNHAKITGLSVNTKYYYQVLTQSGAAMTPAGDTNYYFTTAPTTGSPTPFSFAIWGDSGNASTAQNNVAKQVFAKKPNLTIVAGDISYPYTTDFANNNSKYFTIYSNTGQNSMAFSPYYVTCGNHETSCLTVMQDHSLPQGGTNSTSTVQASYSFDYGNVHFVALNTNASHAYNPTNPGTSSDPQVRWAYNDLKASSQPWKVVYWHHNGWSAGSHSTQTDIVTNLMKMLADLKAADPQTGYLGIWGHSHAYERWPQNVSGYANVQFYTIGNGGQSGTTSCKNISPACDTGSGLASPTVASTTIGTAGFLWMQVNGNAMTANYVGSGGKIEDVISLTTNGTVPTNPPATATPTTIATSTPTKTPTPTPTSAPINTNTPSPLPTLPTACLPGDANRDCKVDGIDYVVWVNHYSPTLVQSGGYTIGDFDANTKVDGQDFIIWLNNYGRTTGTPTAGSTSTPTSAISTPTTIPSTGFQPTAPYYATFFYPWSTNPNTTTIDPTTNTHTATAQSWSYWSDQAMNPPNTWFSHYTPDVNPTAFDPATELYSSTNDQILYWQLNKLKEAKQEVAISSWWGQGHKTDVAFKYIIKNIMNRVDNPYPKLRWSLYYENEGFGDPSEAQITSDLNYIAANYANQPGMLKINGKPVIFVYGGAEDTATSGYHTRWANANNAATTKFYVVLKVFGGYSSVSPQPDSWHQYSPAVRSDSQGSYSYMVSPGFWLDDGSAVRLGRDLTSFRSSVSSMVSSNATWKLTETWNEWGEGTSVEPGEQVMTDSTGKDVVDPNGAPFKNQYVDALNQLLPPLE